MCRNERVLPFDFGIYKNNILICIIEYDGEGHFSLIRFNRISSKIAKKRFKDTIQNDEIKNKYCRDNHIPLLRIPYWCYDDIESIIDEVILKLDSKDLLAIINNLNVRLLKKWS